MMWLVSLIILSSALCGLLVKMEIIDCLFQRFETFITKFKEKNVPLTIISIDLNDVRAVVNTLIVY